MNRPLGSFPPSEGAIESVDSDWLSVHVHGAPPIYSAAYDSFALELLAPLVASWSASPGVEGFFFVRYAQGGHHVRIRVRARLAHLEDVVRPAITARVRDLCSESSPREAREMRYEPETERYGGVLGLLVAEQFFHQSSLNVLEVLAATAGDHAARMGVGLLGMVLMPAIAGLTRHEEADVLSEFGGTAARAWAQRHEGRDEHGLALADGEGTSEEAARYIDAAWDGVVAGEHLGGSIGRYAQVLRKTTSVLQRLHHEGSLSIRASTQPNWIQCIAQVGMSLAHMHNNRLGLSPGDESRLAKLASRVLRSEA